ncbi:MAG: hypothetical protein IJ157_05430 [Clostridia bacterium]|nr:hypothetical protein [Clostridia bacterium]
MKLVFLGTGAGESYPGLWCDCPHCAYARKARGRNIRANSCAVLDDTMMLDMGPMCFDAAARFGVDLSHVTTLLITHPHPDHLYPRHLHWRVTVDSQNALPYPEQLHLGGPRFTDVPTLHIFGNDRVAEALEPAFREDIHAVFHPIHEGVPFESDGYTVTPVRGNHHEPGFAHSYIIQRDGGTLLYALDTGTFPEDSMALITQKRYDMIVMEGTTGLNEQYGGHMCLENNKKFRQRLMEAGAIRPDTPFLLTHMSPHWCPPHDWYQSMAAPYGITLAYDGMEVEIGSGIQGE